MLKKATPIKVSITPKTIILTLLLGVVIYSLWYVRDLIFIVLTSVVIATFVYGGVTWLKRFKIPRVVGVILIYILGLGIVAAVLYFFVPIFLDELAGIVNILPPESPFANTVGTLGSGELRHFLSELNGSDPFQIIGELRNQFSTTSLVQGLAAIVGGIANLVLILVISFYLSMQEDGVEQFLRLITPHRYEARAVHVWHRSRGKIASWFKGQVLVALFDAVLTYIGLLAIGVPYAFLLSLIAFLLSLIPYGIVLATIPAMVLAFLGGGWTMVLFVVILYVVIQTIENYVLQPFIMRRVTGVPALIVIISLVIGAKFAGLLGLILAVPVAVVILEILDELNEKHTTTAIAVEPPTMS